jgi:hypothetical protein
VETPSVDEPKYKDEANEKYQKPKTKEQKLFLPLKRQKEAMDWRMSSSVQNFASEIYKCERVFIRKS